MNLDDIPPRFEHKFVVSARIANEFRERVRPFGILDSNSLKSKEQRYVITSLYYDTPTLDLYEEAVSRKRTRFKLRVRRYGEGLEDSPVFFEVKHRTGDVIQKARAVVAPLRWARRLVDDHPEALAAEVEFRSRVITRRCRPTLLVRYAREAWNGAIDNYVRITFDTRLQYARVANGEHSLTSDCWESADDAGAVDGRYDGDGDGDHSGSFVIIELKFEQTVPRWLSAAVRDFGMQRRGFSKYSVGIERVF